jgi:hypothetical protein
MSICISKTKSCKYNINSQNIQDNFISTPLFGLIWASLSKGKNTKNKSKKKLKVKRGIGGYNEKMSHWAVVVAPFTGDSEDQVSAEPGDRVQVLEGKLYNHVENTI